MQHKEILKDSMYLMISGILYHTPIELGKWIFFSLSKVFEMSDLHPDILKFIHSKCQIFGVGVLLQTTHYLSTY